MTETESSAFDATPERERALCARNFSQFLRAQASFSAGAESTFDGDKVFSFGATRQPVGPFNSVFVEHRTETVESLLNDAEARFSARGRGFSAYVRKDADPELEAECTARGFLSFGELPVLLLTSDSVSPSQSERLRARPVQTPEEAAEFVGVVADCYTGGGLPRSVTLASFSRPDSLTAPGVHAFLFDLDAEAAAVGLVLLTTELAGLYWIGTRPGLRKRGLGAACTRMLCRHALANGAEGVVLQSAAAATGMYRRLGFREVGRLSCYCRPHAVPSLRSGLPS